MMRDKLTKEDFIIMGEYLDKAGMTDFEHLMHIIRRGSHSSESYSNPTIDIHWVIIYNPNYSYEFTMFNFNKEGELIDID